MYSCMYVWMYVCIQLSINLSIWLPTHLPTYLPIYLSFYLSRHMYIYKTYVCIYIYICTYIHTYNPRIYQPPNHLEWIVSLSSPNGKVYHRAAHIKPLPFFYDKPKSSCSFFAIDITPWYYIYIPSISCLSLCLV